MYIDTRTTLLFVLLVAAAVVTWYFGRGTTLTATSSGTDGTSPLGYYLRDAVLFGTDGDGRIYYQVRAAQVSQTMREDALQLDGVSVEYSADEDVQWQVSADRATAPSDRAFLDLSGSVRLASGTEPGKAETVIETERLRLEPGRHLASTRDEVRLTLGRHRLDAIGMKAYLKEDRLELESKVHGQFRN